ncbi:hypothetical protein OKW41_000511 [Paraburkholderia sp. UCT70]
MATLVRRLLTVALFFGLFVLSIHYVHPYTYPWTESEAPAWWRASDSIFRSVGDY